MCLSSLLSHSFIKLGKGFERHRGLVCVIIGCVGTAIYSVALLFKGSSPVLELVSTVVLAVLFVWMIRLWGEDNCTQEYDVIVVRLGLSFIAQYIIYAALLALPYIAQCICAAVLPMVILFLLRKKPSPSAEFEESASFAKLPDLSTIKKGLLMIMVGLSCAAHGILFIFSDSVSGIWIIGTLILAGISLLAVAYMKDNSLFKGLVCLTLLAQGLSVLLILVFPSNFEWISLSKSLSYATGMILALSIGCRLGASFGESKGRSVSLLMSVYFISFYVATNIATVINPDSTAALIVVLFFLIVAAVIMISNDWTAAFSHASINAHTEELSGDELRSVCERLSRSGGLTQRESEVLMCLFRGLSTKEIAVENCVSKNTVRTQVQSVYRKLDIHNRSNLIELIASERK